MKNKKILALFALPLIIITMVLPLCSFTTVEGSGSGYLTYTYNPALYTEVGYTYHRTTSTIDTYYYSVIPNINQTIIAYDTDADNNPILDLSSIKTYASDYLIAGNDTINYKSQTVSLNPSVYYTSSNVDVIASDVSVYSETPSKAYFTGYFGFEGLILPNETSKNGLNDTAVKLLSSIDSSPLTADELSCDIHIQYVEDYSGEFVYADAYSTVYLEHISNVITSDFVSFNTILKYCLDNDLFYNFEDDPDSIIENLSYQYIKQVDFHFLVGYDPATDLEQVIEGIVLRDILYNRNGNNEYLYTIEDFIADYYYEIGVDDGFDVGYEAGNQNGYNIGYSTGYQIGLSNGENVWGTIGSFLKTTVGGFLDFNITPNINIGGILSMLAGAMLLVAFLKIFAGG